MFWRRPKTTSFRPSCDENDGVFFFPLLDQNDVVLTRQRSKRRRFDYQRSGRKRRHLIFLSPPGSKRRRFDQAEIKMTSFDCKRCSDSFSAWIKTTSFCPDRDQNDVVLTRQ